MSYPDPVTGLVYICFQKFKKQYLFLFSSGRVLPWKITANISLPMLLSLDRTSNMDITGVTA